MKFLKYIFVYLILNVSAFCDLNMYIYKVGQGNFVLLVNGASALVVDCGVGDGYGNKLNTPRIPKK